MGVFSSWNGTLHARSDNIAQFPTNKGCSELWLWLQGSQTGRKRVEWRRSSRYYICRRRLKTVAQRELEQEQSALFSPTFLVQQC